MDKYNKVRQKVSVQPASENEIRITSQGPLDYYVDYALYLLEESGGKAIVLNALGQAINKTVVIAEILKRTYPGLHQDTAISSVSITDVYEPNEEGLLPVETTRNVSMLSITLSAKQLNKNSPGYQAPRRFGRPRPQYNNYQKLPPRQAQPVFNSRYEEPYYGNYQGGRVQGRNQGQVGGRGGAGRGRSRGGNGYYQNEGYEYYQDQGGRGQGRNQGQVGGRGGAGRGRSRGGNGYYQGEGHEYYQDGGYGNYRGGGYGNYQGDHYGDYQGRGYGGYQRGGGAHRNYQGNGYGRGGRGGGVEEGRFNGRGQGRMGSRPRDRDN